MSSRSPGRPRAPDVDEAILDGALRLLIERGYARMSLDGIAATAGVSRPTLYRRWSSKADLAMAALARGIDVESRPPAASSTEKALVSVMRNLCRRLFRPNSMALVGTLLAEERQTPELIELFRDRVFRRRAAMLSELLERGRARGELRADADLGAAIHMMIGSIYAQYLSGERLPKRWVERVVATALQGIGPRRAR
jgi:AcrR family transcriptional regulator